MGPGIDKAWTRKRIKIVFHREKVTEGNELPIRYQERKASSPKCKLERSLGLVLTEVI